MAPGKPAALVTICSCEPGMPDADYAEGHGRYDVKAAMSPARL